MKTKIIYSLLVLYMTVSFNSCDLDSKVYSSFAETNFPQTEEDARSMLTGLYAYFKCNSGAVNDNSNGVWCLPLFTPGYGGWLGLSEMTTDVIYNIEHQNIFFNWGSAFDTYSSYTVSRNITRATYILEVLDKADIPEKAKNQLIAETKCLRAWLMFCFYDLYGPIPVITDPAKLDDIKYGPRPSKEEYFNQMVKDFTEAIPHLHGKTNNTDNWGRVNKGVATMLLMKLYMNDHQYDKALPYAESLTQMGYSLSEDYSKIFSEEHNNENIWSVPSGQQMGNEWFFYMIPSTCAEVSGIKVSPYWGVIMMPWAFYDTYAKEDKRLVGIADNYIGPDGTFYSRDENQGDRLPYGAIMVKYLLPKEQTSTGNLPLVVCRYADIILSLAEIENELNGPTEKALNYLKQITERSGVTHTIPSDIRTSKEKFKEFLLAERGRELYFEGWRRQDMIRFGRYIEYGREQGYPAKDHMVLFPIPPKVIIESGGIVENNPGYE
ncbi:hypothetical protein M2459_000830 [Parabacteroides sp. PF5-5]|uniref:RagB/SusD family nutrient uptake outer membrane protein n=1 Tax=unclassified Parabacteroides TaxID=2649774 RepID=UPI0024733F06|nr:MULTISPECIES: RagB/SusD family nutrient uptake outer membrane protein [unclassified Parabacteroides]MDH6304118.1 hypothetical protein [Parabacteroides sp. PH5-39]MDH6315182.1 hypothetical protein [Parabacteroides sp. PF5-13]MDH6318827.1 hypothetical protein [Parabacteroides sp. PH5-13]MDH6322556.1 hypothetical protein [Parabacteroides sp. PH5-8]MDH6326292.1 hypothetical protein [Parabacteroides sp. PH5-41]